MCTGAEAQVAAAVIAGAGTVASMSAAERADRERKRALVQGIEDEKAITKKSAERTSQYLAENFDPSKRAAAYEGEADKAEKSFGELLAEQAAQGQGEINPATTGAVSDTYTRERARATAGASERARQLSRLMARAGAGGGLAQQDAIRGADYSSDLLGFGVESQMAQRRANARYGGANAAGRDLALLGGLMTAGSMAAGSTGSGRAGTTTTSGTPSIRSYG